MPRTHRKRKNQTCHQRKHTRRNQRCSFAPAPSSKNLDLTDEKVEKLIETLLEKSEFIRKVPPHFNYPRDPNDEPYINLAIEANAVFLISRDNDLLDLMTGFSDECKDFRRRFRKLKIVNPVEFLAIITNK